VEAFALNRSVRKFTAMLSWDKSLAGSLTFWLRAPDGTLLDLHQEMKLYDAYAMATVYLPKEQGNTCLPYVGDWQMIVHGETGSRAAAYQALVVVEDTGTRFAVEYPRRAYEVGEILPLRLSLEEAARHITKVKDLRLEIATLRVPDLATSWVISSTCRSRPLCRWFLVGGSAAQAVTVSVTFGVRSL